MEFENIELENFDTIGRLDHVIKSYGDVVALSDISFSIERGKIIGFLGPNGSGKTTSIQLLLGLSKPKAGTVTLFNRNPFYNSKINNLVGYISEEGIFPKWMTAFEYLHSMGSYNMPSSEARIRAHEVLEEVNLTEVADKEVRKFSKGMRQRVKIAQALLHKPALIMADEPFNGLDPVIRSHMFDLFRKYNREYNTTFFISTHILFEVERLADKIILLYKGRTIAQGTPQRIRDMIQDQPHKIVIQASEPKNIAKLIIDNCDENVVSSISFDRTGRMEAMGLTINTLEPKSFYSQFNDLVVSNSLKVEEIRPEDEGLESLFRTLTVG